MDDAALRAPEARNQDWLSYGRDYYEQRFSPLDQINDRQRRASSAWRGSSRPRPTAASRRRRSSIDGVMYATGSWSVTYAIDARTGKQLWKYDPEVHRKYDNLACCDVVNRGAAFYKGKRLRRRARRPAGRRSMRRAARSRGRRRPSIRTRPYTITGAPRIAKGKIIIGNGGAEYGVRGYVSAYDAETGKLAWRFYTVPGDPSKPQENKALERALPTWKGNDWWKYGGGGTVWDSIVYDPELNLLYVGTGNGSTWNRHVRSPGGGDNLYLASILAINPDNGELVWHYQTMPGDTWDYTAVQPMMLADLNIGGRLRKVIMQAPKNGFFYVLDRATGELLSADKYVEVELGVARRHEDGTPGRDSRRGLQGQGHLHSPGSARRPQLAGDVVQSEDRAGLSAGARQRPLLRAAGKSRDFKRCRAIRHRAAAVQPRARADRAQHRAYEMPYKGRLLAWDPIARKPRWTVEYGAYWNGGTLATAGNLVFQGTAAGDFIAYNAATGEKLWSSWAGTGIVAPPITYSIDGKQYVSVMAGWGGAFPKKHVSYGRLLTFALGGTATLPSKPRPRTRHRDRRATPRRNRSPPDRSCMRHYCVRCHGGATMLPDLRRRRRR